MKHKEDNNTKSNEDEDEKMALLEKIKDASNGPEQVGRRVRLTILCLFLKIRPTAKSHSDSRTR